jgi:AcrR family transcriptional regulator
MSPDVKPVRRYDSTRRRELAEGTRWAMLEAARLLFLERGFAGATMPDIASEAGVSVQTVYKAFGNKPALAKAVFDVAIAGDDEPVPMVQRESLQRVRDEPDPRKMIELYGEHLAAVAPRHVPIQLVILSAAATDPEAGKVWRQLQEERLRGMSMFARSLHSKGHLRRGLSATEARDVLWVYNSAELFQLLVIERGWSAKRYGRWVAAALTAALLPSPGPGHREAPEGRRGS